MISSIKIEDAKISNIKLIDAFYSADDRGVLTKSFSKGLYSDNGISFNVVESIIIKSNKNALRGLHYQRQVEIGKLLTCVYGKFFVVIVDVRKGSSTLGDWISATLTKNRQVYIPRGFALGTYAQENSCLMCLNDEKMFPEYEYGIRWDDEKLSIKWPFLTDKYGPIVSEKDRGLHSFEDYCTEIINK